MPALVIGGTAYDAAVAGARTALADERAFNNALLARRREWTFVIVRVSGSAVRLTSAQFAALKVQTEAAGLTVTGDLVEGETLTGAGVEIVGDVPILKVGPGVRAYLPTVRVWEP